MATQSNTLAWRIPMDRRAWGAVVHGVAKSQKPRKSEMTEQVCTHRAVKEVSKEAP